MKSGLRFSAQYLPWYILISSLFLGSLFVQYAAFFLFVIGFFLIKKPSVKINSFFFVSICFIGIAIISYIYNFINGSADSYSIVFWFFSYLPPIILILILPSYSQNIEFEKIYSFYKKLVYIESFFLIFSVIKYKKFIVGDFATGTVGDANWIAFHICVVLIYEISKLIEFAKSKRFSLQKNSWSLVEIIYFIIVFLIPESTANLGFLLIVVGVMFFLEFIYHQINIKRIITFLVIACAGLLLISQTMVYERIEDAVVQLQKKDIEKDTYLSKVKIYKKLFNGEIYSNTNWLLGSGPATFTSRASVMRMPDERVNAFPIPLPYFKSNLFKKYISPIYANWKKTKESYGNFASPQTTIISISVELGVAGIICFIFLFYFIFYKIKTTQFSSEKRYLQKFAFYFSLFYFMNLFHLNFWEYPIITFTYMIFIFVVLNRKANLLPVI